MGLTEGHQAKTVWENPAEIVRALTPENPVIVFAPTILQDRARQFLEGFPGLVTYAVKSNPGEAVIQNLVAAGRSACTYIRPVDSGHASRAQRAPSTNAELRPASAGARCGDSLRPRMPERRAAASTAPPIRCSRRSPAPTSR